ncbi:MAG: hypothetical protein IJZ85_09545 [Lachnospiraceae bacterium]|nr:hypothetical protein [Lachnospiraceae bacterium]
MRGNELLDKMELVDDAYVEAAGNVSAAAVPKKKKAGWIKWVAVAACVSLVVLAGFAGASRFRSQNPQTIIGGILREYKNAGVMDSETAIIWPWEYQTISEQYTVLELNGKSFNSGGREINESLLGESIGIGEVVGYDIYTDKEYRMSAEVRRISGISEQLMVAVKLGDEFCVFKYHEYDPPTTFGEVLDNYSLPETLRFERFTVYEGHTDQGHYRLKDDGGIWEILNTCRDAKFVGDDAWGYDEGKYISFTSTSEALGVYKKVFYVTADGYVKTNIFEWGYIFEIGEEAADQIITYAKENSEEAQSEPYTYTLAGTLTEIVDGYILIDDSVLCTDPEDGMVFRVPTDDLRISRCIDFGGIGVGDIVVVYFNGSIDVDAGNVVEGAYSLSEGILADGGVAVPE